jgi:hypothetical protein
VSTGGARAGEGAPGSRATGATAAVSFGSEEAGPRGVIRLADRKPEGNA